MSSPLHIVLTGAPGSGKTTAVRTLSTDPACADWRSKVGGVTIVDEAATQIYTQRDTRWDRLDLEGQREAQRDIYRLQVRQEQAARELAERQGHRLVLLDRGTLDGAVYWPDGPAAYWDDLDSHEAAELNRYDGVLLLESTAALPNLYDGDASNATRFEDAAAALENAKRLAALWTRHERVGHVAAAERLEDKLRNIADAVRAMMET